MFNHCQMDIIATNPVPPWPLLNLSLPVLLLQRNDLLDGIGTENIISQLVKIYNDAVVDGIVSVIAILDELLYSDRFLLFMCKLRWAAAFENRVF